MQYCSYFAKVLDSSGVPHLSVDQFKRFMNIVAIESKLSELKKVKTRYNFNYIFNLEKKLTELTGNLKPEDLLKEMIALSRD